MVGLFTDAAEDRIRARACLVACLFAVVTSYFVAGIGEMTSEMTVATCTGLLVVSNVD